jgi:purine-cytosine permease-like protein
MHNPKLKLHLNIEQHGVDAVPKAERTKNWADLFVIYTGLNIAIGGLLVGGILIPAFSWAEAVFVIVAGNLFAGTLMFLMGHMGVDHGIPAAVMSRLFLGYPAGASLCSIVILASVTGWFAVNAEVGGLAVDKVLSEVFGFSSPELMILVLSVTTVFVAMIGIESIKWLSRVLASDISRYVKSRRHNSIGTIMGIVPAAIFLGGLGALSSLATGDWNPINGIEVLGLGAPALFVIVFSTWTTNDVNLYNGGLALSNIFPALSRWQNTLILGAAGTALAMMRITENFTTFLGLLANVFGPLIGVALSDYFVIRRSRFDPHLIYEEGGGALYPRGVNWVAMGALILGIVVAFLTPNDLPASIVSIAVSGGVYWILMRLIYVGNVAEKVGLTRP